jgi:hypothetical protein
VSRAAILPLLEHRCSAFLVIGGLLQQIMSKRKQTDLKRHFFHAAKQKAPEAPVILQLSKYTFRFRHDVSELPESFPFSGRRSFLNCRSLHPQSPFWEIPHDRPRLFHDGIVKPINGCVNERDRGGFLECLLPSPLASKVGPWTIECTKKSLLLVKRKRSPWSPDFHR